jgi:hypothetical protein
VYYHCTNGKGSCSKNYVREEVIDEQVKVILQGIKLDKTRLAWVKEALKLSHQEEKSFHQKMVKSFQTKINELQAKIDKAYDDKLEGKITEDLWVSKFKQWSDQKEKLQIKLNAQQKANKSYYETGVRLIELSNRAYELYEKQDVKEKQKLLKFLLSNSKIQGKSVDFVLKIPFILIVETKKRKSKKQARAFINSQVCSNGVRWYIGRYPTGAISSAIGNLGMLWLGLVCQMRTNRAPNIREFGMLLPSLSINLSPKLIAVTRLQIYY